MNFSFEAIKNIIRREIFRITKNKTHSGIMVALKIPAEIARSICLPGEDYNKLHVTLCYIPKIGDDPENMVKIQEAISPLAQSFAPIQGCIGGTGRFNASASSDNLDVFYASFSSPGLESLRAAVLKAVRDVGFDPPNKHGFTPHITLKYIDPNEENPKANVKDLLPFAIDKIVIGKNDQMAEMQFNGVVVLKGQPNSSDVHVPVPMGNQKKKPAGPQTSGAIPPEVANLEVKVEKDADDSGDDMDQLYYLNQVISGVDWELVNSTDDEDGAKETAIENLKSDPHFYKRKRLEAEQINDPVQKDNDDDEEDPNGISDDNVGLSLDLGSGTTREKGHIGLDLYPHDHGTLVHDLALGIPFPDSSAEQVQLVNALHYMDMDDPQPLLKEVERVLMPGGRFTYEGPEELQQFPEGLILSDYEDNKDAYSVGKSAATKDKGSPTYRQVFTRIATPDAATSNDAEPGLGAGGNDELPADEYLALAAAASYNQPSESGRGNKIFGYPSQGALVGKSSNSVKNIPIFKTNEAKQIVYGVVLTPDEIDSQDDFMSAEEIEKAAHEYLIKSRTVGGEHLKPILAVPVESYIAPQDFETNGQYGPQVVKKGAWILGVKVLDPKEWKKVVNGEYTGFSVGGLGSRS